jgi:hypothetical protein
MRLDVAVFLTLLFPMASLASGCVGGSVEKAYALPANRAVFASSRA